MDNCIFCKIAKKEIPCTTVYEDDKMIAFLDISQITKGHTLIIPKKHVENVYEIDEETIAYLYSKVPQLAKAITKAFNAKGMNVVNNNGTNAGQTVFHYHIHLVPRYDENDGLRMIFTSNMDKYSKDDLEQIASNIREQL